MWSVECGMIGYADEEFINEEFVLHSTLNIQHSTLRLCRNHSTFNIKHSTLKKMAKEEMNIDQAGKLKALQAAMSKIEKDFGKGSTTRR